MAETTLPSHEMTIEEYLAFEKKSPVKHEFVGGRLYAMIGTPKRHNFIAGNVYRKLIGAAEDTSCRVFIADVKVCPPGDRCYYPDVMVSCEPASGDDHVEEAPCLIVEVTSSSTAATDRREKLIVYGSIPTLRAYLLVDQDAQHAERRFRDEDGIWQRTDHISGGSVPIPRPETRLALDDIYQGL